MTVSTRYRHTGLVLVRATTDPGDLDPPTHLDLSDPAAVEQEGRAWLTKVWARQEVREALHLASPVLGARLDQLLDTGAGPHPVKELRRAIVSVASYLLRWQRRATPFGLFAGITAAAIGPAKAEVGGGHRAVLRADAEWATTLIDRLERHPGLRPRLTVVADNARIVRDGRVIVHRRAEVGASTPGPLRESSVRLNRPVQFALAAAGLPIRFDALAAEMTARFPSASPDKIYALLHGLVDGGLLITSLRPPMTTVDALSHLVRALRVAGGENLSDVAELLQELDGISTRLAHHNSTTDRMRTIEIRKALGTQMTAVVPDAGHVFAADVRLDAMITVPERVLTEATVAAGVLLRVGTQPFGSAAWLDYHARFRAHYGPGALVPVLELVADSGLGYPAGYLGAPRARPAWRMLTERDAALMALIQQATVGGAEEITLTDTDIEALTVGEHADIIAPQRVELGVAVYAASTQAIDRGDFQLRVTAAPRVPTSMAARFAHLLDDADRARLAATYAAEPENSTQDGTVAVQLSFPPRRPHNENVVRVQPLLSDVLPLSEHPDPAHPHLGVISVDDLAVTADADQMYLVQRSTGRRVIPRIPHALDTAVQTPPLARFLAEVADARNAVFRGFDLGAARTLPYVPRIRYRRTVLSAARWILSGSDLSGWQKDSLRSWRQRWRVPARVVLCHGELRLPLDLDQELDRALLRAQVERAERIELQDDGPPDGQGWIGRPAELLIPMTATTPSSRPLPATAAPGAVLRPGGSAIVHAQLVGNPARFDEILTAHLPAFVDSLDGLVGPWWVRRHRDMIRPESDQHLAVLLRLTSPEQYGPVAARVAAFAADLHARGLPCQLTLASHPQHPARYGEGPALAAAEDMFTADTAAAIAQITTSQASGIPAQALAAASMAHLAASFAPDPQTGYRALVGCLRREHGPLDRTLRDHALDLADPDDGYRAVRALPGGEAVAAAWTARDTTLTTYHHALTQQQRDPGTVLRTLLHEHHVRAVGVDPTFEKETGRLTRGAALRRLALAGAR
ncbi:lantibiotic dehydratase [Saccharothrix deserti]|uniref:lantibiotic dehydratase n=1 Tax=Saccharothrix deserti TaxID=2593674 RepID=UPI00131E9C95|nr:lantibiotic dehydratase [Saccharothrix deserti]